MLKKLASRIVPFTRGDWMAFNGATPFDGDFANEAKNNQPLIAYAEVEFDPGADDSIPPATVCEVTLIGDLSGMEIVVSWDGGEGETSFHMTKNYGGQAACKAEMERALRVLEAGDIPRGFH